MILVDTGPLVALFDPADHWHRRCVTQLEKITEPLVTTLPVLTEAIHLLRPDSKGTRSLGVLLEKGVLESWPMHDDALRRAFDLMDEYASVPMDFADASLVCAAEDLGARRVFTVDRRDFGIYRIRKGHRRVTFESLP